MEDFYYFVFLTTLELAGMAFICAAARDSCFFGRRRPYLTLWVIGPLFFTALACWEVERKFPYYVAIAVLAAGLALPQYVSGHGRAPRGRAFEYGSALALALVLVVLVHKGQMWAGAQALLTWVYLVAGVRYWLRYRQTGAGAWVASGGFFAWAMVFPAGILLDAFAPSVHVEDEVWNIPKYIVVVGILLTFLQEQIEKTEHLALHDALTGVPNRRLFEDRLQKALEHAERDDTGVAVLMVDLDGFKEVNDLYGHAMGDAVLVAFAERLQALVRKSDTVARTGGDEFTLIIADVRESWDRAQWVRKMRKKLDAPLEIDGMRMPVRASIGAALYPEDASTVKDLCAVADAAMYADKRSSRDRPMQFEESSIGPLA
jgi:diguanylate cyclase (GGDEF)-like protein